MDNIQYIDTQKQLFDFCEQIKNEPWLAIDTEFIREKTYYPQFCLLQIASVDRVACIDPLALPSLESLYEILYNPSIIKVIHACRQDLEIFYHLVGKLPEPIFDTQLAAPILGFQENPGYAMLVSNLLNINLGKAHTRTDWSQRPLSDAQLKYAADDVIYLVQIYQIIVQKLSELGRSDWLVEDFVELQNTELYSNPPDKAWMKVRGKNKLTGKQLSILQTIAEWREQTAQSENRPRNWLLRDDLMLELVKLQPETIQEFKHIRGINERMVQRYGKHLCHLIVKAKQQTPVKIEDKVKAPKKTPHQEAILDILSAIVRIRAGENSINPAILSTRKELGLLLFDDPECSLLHGWRYTMVGQELTAMLQGKHALLIKSGIVDFLDCSQES